MGMDELDDHGWKGGADSPDGMTLLDHFAGLAMQEALCRTHFDSHLIVREDQRALLAALAYDLAEAMLAERKRRLG